MQSIAVMATVLLQQQFSQFDTSDLPSRSVQQAVYVSAVLYYLKVMPNIGPQRIWMCRLSEAFACRL